MPSPDIVAEFAIGTTLDTFDSLYRQLDEAVGAGRRCRRQHRTTRQLPVLVLAPAS